MNHSPVNRPGWFFHYSKMNQMLMMRLENSEWIAGTWIREMGQAFF